MNAVLKSDKHFDSLLAVQRKQIILDSDPEYEIPNQIHEVHEDEQVWSEFNYDGG